MTNNIGVELEVGIFDKEFNPINSADMILNKRIPGVIPEMSKNILEINSVVGTPTKVSLDLLSKLDMLDCVANNEDMRILPIEFCPDIIPEIRKDERYYFQEKYLKEKFLFCGKILGHHIHLDLMEPDSKKIIQITLLKLIDPLIITLTSSSPFYEFMNWRNHLYREIVYAGLDFQGNMQPFADTYNGYLQSLNEHFLQFSSKLHSKGISIPGDKFNRFNCVWGPVRINEKYNTIELRSSGANPDIRVTVAVTYLVHYLNKQITFRDLTLESLIRLFLNVSDKKKAHQTLLDISSRAMKHGLNDPIVSTYSKNIFEFAFAGIDIERVPFYPILRDMLFNNKTVSSLLKEKSSDIKSFYSNSYSLFSSLLPAIPEEIVSNTNSKILLDS